MQILGKRSKVLLIAVAIVMLVAIGVSFAAWDSMSTVKAASGNSSTYANAKVGDIVEFGQYYQTGNKVSNAEDAEYEKTAIRWIVVDKDERSGQLTLMSEKILAAGSYFGNWYYNNNSTNAWGAHYDSSLTVAGIAYNQAYVESTARAFLNNLERLDLGGDEFSANGYLPSNKHSTIDSGLLSSIGFSNSNYWTGQTGRSNPLLKKDGFYVRTDKDEIYYRRPISNIEYRERPATRGFYDEAFSDKEKNMIVPKVIAGYTGHRWPDSNNDVSTKSFVEGSADKVWLPSVSELNISNWPGTYGKHWMNPSDAVGSNVFEYFENYSGDDLAEKLKTTRTQFAVNSYVGNFSIPVYEKGTTKINSNIDSSRNSSDHYWTRTPSSLWFSNVYLIEDTGSFAAWNSLNSYIGVRPCVILKY